jgi:hypothetical protein
MSKKRMAGDKINEDRNFAARQAIAADPEKSEAKLAKVSGYDLSGYSDKDVIMAFQGDSFGDDDYRRLTGGGPPVNKPEGGVVPEMAGEPVVPEVAPTPAPAAITGPIEVEIDTGSGDVTIPDSAMPRTSPFALDNGNVSQTVIQDNDQTSSVVGNNNTVNQDQDNNIRNFGGRTFNPEDWKSAWMNSKFAA